MKNIFPVGFKTYLVTECPLSTGKVQWPKVTLFYPLGNYSTPMCSADLSITDSVVHHIFIKQGSSHHEWSKKNLVHHSLEFRKRKTRFHFLRHQNWGTHGKLKFSPFLGTFRLVLYQSQGPQMWCTDGWYQRWIICNVFLDHYDRVQRRKTRFAFVIEKQAIWSAWSLLFFVKTDHFHGK